MPYDRIEALQRPEEPLEVSYWLEKLQDELEDQVRVVVSGEATLTVNDTTTVVSSALIQAGMRVVLQAASASASDEQMYVAPADIINGQFTINHASTGETDKLVFWMAT